MPLQCESLEADPHCLLSDQFTIKSLTQPLTVRIVSEQRSKEQTKGSDCYDKTNVTAEILQQIF